MTTQSTSLGRIGRTKLDKYCQSIGLPTGADLTRVLFVLHTYHALVFKLLGAELVLSNAVVPGIRSDYCFGTSVLDDAKLVASLEYDIEESELFRQINILNFIEGTFFRKKGGADITFKQLLNLTPCLFLLSPTCPSYGWIISEEGIKLNGEKTCFPLINVYYPNVPTIITGQIFPVRKETVIKLGNPSKEIIDLLLYSLRSPESILYLPWEEENEDEFKKRAENFGLKVSTEVS